MTDRELDYLNLIQLLGLALDDHINEEKRLRSAFEYIKSVASNHAPRYEI